MAACGIFLLAAPAARTQQSSPAPAKPTTGSAPATSSKGTAATTAKPHTVTTAKTPTPLVLKTDKDKTSYALGMTIGKSLQKQEIDVDPAILTRAIKDTLSGGKLALTDQEAQATLTQFQADMKKNMEAKMQAAGEENKKKGDAFLAANKDKEGVVTLPSGLQYKILTAGTGPKPTASDTVVCQYRGTLIDGTEFDSSYKRGQPATFPVGQVIHGWTEALQLMPTGSKWQLFIPSDLAYGARGAGATIGPNSTLVFEVELVSIQGKEAPASGAAGAGAAQSPQKQR
jgi:FKBP-type peptidyl-prolyl cis-trans isomerase